MKLGSSSLRDLARPLSRAPPAGTAAGATTTASTSPPGDGHPDGARRPGVRHPHLDDHLQPRPHAPAQARPADVLGRLGAAQRGGPGGDFFGLGHAQRAYFVSLLQFFDRPQLLVPHALLPPRPDHRHQRDGGGGRLLLRGLRDLRHPGGGGHPGALPRPVAGARIRPWSPNRTAGPDRGVAGAPEHLREATTSSWRRRAGGTTSAATSTSTSPRPASWGEGRHVLHRRRVRPRQACTARARRTTWAGPGTTTPSTAPSAPALRLPLQDQRRPHRQAPSTASTSRTRCASRRTSPSPSSTGTPTTEKGICSTAYWYQTLPHKPFPPLLPVEQRLPSRWGGSSGLARWGCDRASSLAGGQHHALPNGQLQVEILEGAQGQGGDACGSAAGSAGAAALFLMDGIARVHTEREQRNRGFARRLLQATVDHLRQGDGGPDHAVRDPGLHHRFATCSRAPSSACT